MADLIPSINAGDDASAIAQTRVDWRETPDAHVLTAEIPGMRKEDVKVQVEDGGVLRISGERSEVKESFEGDACHRVENRSGSFLRRVKLPENVKAEEIHAALDSGVLTVTVPKLELGGGEQRGMCAVEADR